jgi:hypothetical protein
MKSRGVSVLIVAGLFLSGVARAASIDEQQTVKLDRAAVVSGFVLPPGTYRVDLAAGPDIARFVQGKRTVAEAPCKVGLAQIVYPGNAVYYRTEDGGHDRLMKIVFASSKLAVDFPTDPAIASDAPATKTAGSQ